MLGFVCVGGYKFMHQQETIAAVSQQPAEDVGIRDVLSVHVCLCAEMVNCARL